MTSASRSSTRVSASISPSQGRPTLSTGTLGLVGRLAAAGKRVLTQPVEAVRARRDWDGRGLRGPRRERGASGARGASRCASLDRLWLDRVGVELLEETLGVRRARTALVYDGSGTPDGRASSESPSIEHDFANDEPCLERDGAVRFTKGMPLLREGSVASAQLVGFVPREKAERGRACSVQRFQRLGIAIHNGVHLPIGPAKSQALELSR